MSIRTLPVIALCLLLAACNSKLTADNFARLQPGMSRSEVERLFGKPDECSGAMGLTSCQWGSGQRFVSVQFAADQVLLFSGQGLK